jgi:membrane protein
MQLSWVICLIGAEIAYAGQNIRNYEFAVESKNISRRYWDFLLLSVTNLIMKRFEKGEIPYTANEISQENKIPIHLTNRILYRLTEVGIVNEIKDRDSYANYQPAVDINQVTLSYFFSKMDQHGVEHFKIDKKHKFHAEWEKILQLREDMFLNNKDVLVKNL